MKRIQYSRYGGPQEMRLEEVEVGNPGPTQLCVRVNAASVNPVDWKIRRGELKIMTGNRFPRAMGNDFAGTIESVGSRVSGYRVGDAVFGVVPLKAAGAFAELLVTDASLVAQKPEALSFVDAACLPTAGTAAWIGLVEKSKVSRGQTVFINGCMGNVGRAAAQIARSRGAILSGSCRLSDFAQARQMGFETVVDYRTVDWTKLAALFDIVFDTVGTLSIPQAKTLLRPGGRFLDLSGSMSKMMRGIFTRGYQMVMASHTTTKLNQLATLAVDGTLSMSVGDVVQLKDAITAISRLETTGLPKGKLVIGIVPQG